MKTILKKTASCRCLCIYPKAMGGVKYENLPADQIDLEADRWKREEDGKYYYLFVWDRDQKKLVPYFPLPEVIGVSADWVARMLSCPYTKLKAIKTGLLSKLAGWIPVVVLIAAIIFLVIMGG